jgi:hypothetical protein
MAAWISAQPDPTHLSWAALRKAIFPKVSARALRERWESVEKPGRRTGSWCGEEDSAILAHVEAVGPGSWADCARARLPWRTGKQIRERYAQHLAPGVSRAPPNPQEDEQIFAHRERIGPRWKEIAALVGAGRTDCYCKNRWYTMVRRTRRLAVQADEPSAATSTDVPAAREVQPEEPVAVEICSDPCAYPLDLGISPDRDESYDGMPTPTDEFGTPEWDSEDRGVWW